MPSPRNKIDMDALNAITDRVLSYTPPPQKGKKKKRSEDEIKYPSLMKERTKPPEPKIR
jgi:hypothetical protein